MTSMFDPLNVILLAAAAFVVWRLFGVLGQRTGHENPGFDPFARPTPSSSAEPTAKPEPSQATPEGEIKPVWDGVAERGSALAMGLETIFKTDPAFNVSSFVNGAKLAYEMVLESYAKGDKSALKPLLSKEVQDEFFAAIDKRNRDGYTAFLQFVGVKSAKLERAAMFGKRAQISVRFVSEMISATTDAKGSAVDGDTKEIRDITDHWVFERDLTSRDPNWRLMDTTGDD